VSNEALLDPPNGVPRGPTAYLACHLDIFLSSGPESSWENLQSSSSGPESTWELLAMYASDRSHSLTSLCPLAGLRLGCAGLISFSLCCWREATTLTGACANNIARRRGDLRSLAKGHKGAGLCYAPLAFTPSCSPVRSFENCPLTAPVAAGGGANRCAQR